MPDTGGTTAAERLTRREALKRGVALGGALLWATPVVQSIGMSRAFASEPSPDCVTYCVKFEFTSPDDLDLTGEWVELGRGAQNCLSCPGGGVNDPSSIPEGLLDGFEITGDRRQEIWVGYPKSCTLAELEGSGDDIDPWSAAAKCGSGGDRCNTVLASSEDRSNDDLNWVRIEVCGNEKAISHIELIIRCCG